MLSIPFLFQTVKHFLIACTGCHITAR